MNCSDIATSIGKKLVNTPLNPSVYMSMCHTLDRAGKTGVAFQDLSYLPFYYYLGREVTSDGLIVTGFGIGLEVASFMLSRPPVKQILAIHDPGAAHYSPNFGVKNATAAGRVRPTVVVGRTYGEEFCGEMERRKWGAALFCSRSGHDQTLADLEAIAPHLAEGAIVAIDGVRDAAIRAAVDNFCAARNLGVATVKTRYGHAIVVR